MCCFNPLQTPFYTYFTYLHNSIYNPWSASVPSSTAGVRLAWEFLQTKWDAITSKLTAGILASVVGICTRGFSTAADIAEVEVRDTLHWYTCGYIWSACAWHLASLSVFPWAPSSSLTCSMANISPYHYQSLHYQPLLYLNPLSVPTYITGIFRLSRGRFWVEEEDRPVHWEDQC